MNRRRALMGVQDNKPKLLFEVKNQTVTSGTRIITDVAAYKSGRSTTILLDFTNTSNPTTADAVGSTWKALGLYDTPNSRWTLNVGKSKKDGTYQKYVFSGTFSNSWSANMNASNPTAGRHRYVITHEADSPTSILRYLKGTGTPYTYTDTRAQFYASSGGLTFGVSVDNANSLPNGTISLAQVWDGILSDDEINAFFA